MCLADFLVLDFELALAFRSNGRSSQARRVRRPQPRFMRMDLTVMFVSWQIGTGISSHQPIVVALFVGACYPHEKP
jgi:hypothetical protein